MAEQTGVVDINSELIRKRWVMDNLIKANDVSFTAAYTGNSFNSVVYQETNTNAKDGHTVTFDFTGFLTGKAVKGKETATGTGEAKKKFSSNLTVERYRYVVDNGDKFDAVNIGDLSIAEHQDSISKLANMWVRAKDQACLDTMQQGATHRVVMGSTFDFNAFLDLDNIIKTGIGYKQMGSADDAPRRLPLKPFMLEGGKPVWLFVIDSTMKNMLLKSTGAQSVLSNADVRGNDNRLIKGALGKIGQFLIVEADTFFGTTDVKTTGDFITTEGYTDISKTEIIAAGLRQYTSADGNTITSWTGEDIQAGAKLYSRGLILGAGAMQIAMGMLPDYKYERSKDFGITSESCLEVWTGFKPTKLKAENDDYAVHMGGISHGIVAVDVEVGTPGAAFKINKKK